MMKAFICHFSLLYYVSVKHAKFNMWIHYTLSLGLLSQYRTIPPWMSLLTVQVILPIPSGPDICCRSVMGNSWGMSLPYVDVDYITMKFQICKEMCVLYTEIIFATIVLWFTFVSCVKCPQTAGCTLLTQCLQYWQHWPCVWGVPCSCMFVIVLTAV